MHHPVHRLKALCHGQHKTPGYRVQSVNGFTVINPFTAMLAGPSLGKPPIKLPNLKPLRFFSSFVSAHEKISVKMFSIENRFVTGPSNILSPGMYVCMDILQDVAVKGLRFGFATKSWLGYLSVGKNQEEGGGGEGGGKGQSNQNIN